MSHPTRGKDKFNWDDVKNDRHRMNYLGNSVKMPNSRHKDVFWYAKQNKGAEDLQKELKAQKEREAKLTGFYLAKGFGAKLPEELPETTTNEKESKEEIRRLKQERKQAREAKKLSKEKRKSKSKRDDKDEHNV
ncbi:hypothetical protein PSACC_01324 [Paramicrosporidium saccamoebae]|uniref:Multiple myeloma tumor-associated protein 2-like N-terminal domain-containing protein n=1 Tax=Paramicrosporidium saccamoebae TaxID=1246581 RepID=A0A2H9TM44_9FUNG|nr:hypothetical protein PSACC_01324 [Paramicrosporidium saccamoebae]